ncbi:MAG: M23 family metallopeptidase [Oscillospiraceae bacterium]|jgi:murein DD-endopeptidase MepM/ murein hydrolase activator NlpD|nr:M23 family metallopeptidase [Oscillospiraceae bacterium]
MEEPKARGQKNSQASFIRLLASLTILGLVLILRVFFPGQTRDFLQKTVAGGMDYTVLLGNVGDSLRAFVLGVPHPDASEEMKSVNEEDGPETEPSLPLDPDGHPAYGSPGETYDPEKEPPPDDAIGLGGFDTPVLWADARFFMSLEDDVDDTLPLPFGMQKPDRVDYGVYELPFASVLPAEGKLSSPFGYRIHPVYGDWRFHYGIDIANKSGTPIAAFADGTVAATGVSPSYGNYLLVEHEGGFVTLYAHCKKITVKAGQKVSMGQTVAAVGSTGVSTGPHLHFELRLGGAFLDPALYVEI